jgi:dihydrofolate reductase
MPKLLNLIVACAENRVIGRDGKLPWHIPEDAQFLHDRTAGNICVLGRVCYDTWPAVHADGRRPVVLTNHPLFHAPGYAARSRERMETSLRQSGHAHADPQIEHAPIVARTLTEALAAAESLPGEIYICGGQRVYEETLALVRPMRLYLTLVHAVIPGDRFFPEWRHLPWRELSRREGADPNYRCTFLTLDRGLPAL